MARWLQRNTKLAEEVNSFFGFANPILKISLGNFFLWGRCNSWVFFFRFSVDATGDRNTLD